MKVPKKREEYQIHHDDRIPLHTVMLEARPFDQTQVASAAFQGAPPGIRILQLTLQKRVYTKVGTSLGAAVQDREISGLTISALIRSQDLKAFTDPQALIRLFGNGWTTEFLTEVMKLTAQQAMDLLRMAQTFTMGQIFALYAAFGQEAFKHGPYTPSALLEMPVTGTDANNYGLDLGADTRAAEFGQVDRSDRAGTQGHDKEEKRKKLFFGSNAGFAPNHDRG